MPSEVAFAVVGSTWSAATGWTAVAYAAVYVAATVGISYAIGAAAASLQKKPPSNRLSEQGGNDRVTFRAAAAACRVIYGAARVGGVIVYARTNSPINEEFVKVLATVPSQAPYEVPIALQDAEWRRTIAVQQLIYANDSSDVSFVAIAGVTYAAGVYTFGAADAAKMVQIDYVRSAAGTPNEVLHLVVVIASHECEAIGTVYLNGVPLTLDAGGHCTAGPYAGWVRVKKYLGTTTQAADPELMAESLGEWTDAHRLAGHAYLYVRLYGQRTIFPNGMPNITADVLGKKDIYDPRTGGRAYSTNAALCIANYLSDTRYGVGSAMPAEFDTAALIAEANVCEESVILASGAIEQRYTLNGVVDTAVSWEDTVRELLTACGGMAIWTGGKWVIRTARYVAPTLSIDEGDARAGLRVVPLPSRRERFNAVKGLFVGPANVWQPADYPAVLHAGYEAADGERIYGELNLPFTTSGYAAQRLAKIELLRHRQDKTMQYPCKLLAAQLTIGDTIQVTNTRFGWSNKVFEVVGWEFATYDDEAGAPALGVDLTLREAAASVYAWTTADEQPLDPFPDSSLASPLVVPPVTGLALASGEDHAVVGNDGQAVARALVSWGAPTGNFMGNGRIELEARRTPDEPAYRLVLEAHAGAREAYWTDVATGADYLLRARFVNEWFVGGPWTAPFAYTVQPINIAPADVAALTVTGTLFTWSAVADAALAGYRIRHHAGFNEHWETAAALHSGLLTESPWAAPSVPAGQTTYLIKAVDRLGNESLNARAVTLFGAGPLGRNVVLTRDYDALGYPGTKVGGTVVSGDLTADATGALWNADENTLMWNADPSVLMWSITYYTELRYEDIVDISADAARGGILRLPITVAGASYQIEYREDGSEPFWSGDSALMWQVDGNTPMWSAVGPYLPWPGELPPKDTRYQVRVTVAGGVTQGVISTFAATVDVADVFEHFDDVPLGAAGARLVLSNDYRAIKTVQSTIQTTGSTAVTVKVIDKDVVAGPLLQGFDPGGSGVATVVDATVVGY
jgi:Putative phage tail protein